jgi:hypothetical protein
VKELLLSLFNLDGVDFHTEGGWEIRFLTEWAPAVIVLGCLGVGVLVWLVYAFEKGTASPRFKAMLAGLRTLAMAALVLALLKPAVVVRKFQLREAFVLVLADASDSMKLTDRYRDEGRVARLAYAMGLTGTPEAPVDPDTAAEMRGMSRAEIANRVLANSRDNVIERIARASRVRQFVFAGSLSPAGTDGGARASTAPAGAVRPLVIVPDGPTTQIGECIREAAAELRGQRIAAMVVLSDWCSNSGIPPEEATRYALDAESTFPIFTVGVGDPAEQRDIAVAGVSANRVAFLKDPLLFNVAIEQVGCDGADVPLELRIGDQVVARKNVSLGPGRKYYTISHRPEKEGVYTYVVTVPPGDEELSQANNAVEHRVTIKDDKVRVLLVSARPTWEWRYLKNALVRDETVETSVWLQSADANWVMAGGRQVNELPLARKELVDKYDVVMLLGAAAEALSEEQLENLRSFVGDFGGGLVFCAGGQVVTEAFAQTPLAKCLPVSVEPPSGVRPEAAVSRSFKPRVTPEGWTHPAMKLVEDAHQNRELWESLPGLFWFHPVGDRKPAARVLAVHPEEKTEAGPFPIFVEQRYGAGKVFFSATDETWRWRFLIGDKYFYRFWRQVLGLTAANKLLGGAKRLTLSVARNRYTVGQKVEIEAKRLTDMLRPSEERFLMATVDLPGGTTQKVRLTLVDPTQGMYRGSFVARRIGNYAVWMKAPDTEKPETVPFSVSMSTLESESRRLDVETMRRVASLTSGWACTIDRIGEVPGRIKSESMRSAPKTYPTEVWDSWGVLLLFALPLAAEWWLRKRRLLT